MIFSKSLIAVSKTWKTQNGLSRSIIVISLFLVLFAYLPTLQYDYVTQDQWRAFRYSTEAQTPYDREKACVDMVSKFYALTGRPLVWVTECAEHTVVAKISDFAYLRPVVFAIVLATVMYLGTVVAPMVGGLTMGILAASAFVMVPGYSFMYLQGLTAAMVLISIVLATASFSVLRKVIDEPKNARQFKFKKFLRSFLLFFSASLIYPAWAFLVISLALIAFGFDKKKTLIERFRDLLLTILFYLVAAIFYYLFVKLTAFALLKFLNYDPHLGSYEVAMQLSPTIIWGRILEAVSYFYVMPPLNFVTPHGIPVFLLGIFSISIGWYETRNRGSQLFSVAANAGLFFVIGSIILLASISPWLFSHMDSISNRHLIPWYMFFCLAAVGFFVSVSQKFSEEFRKWVPLFVLMFLVVPAAVVQNKLSFLEVTVSAIEIQKVRSSLDNWLDSKGWKEHRFLLVVMPTKSRPAFIEKMLNGAYPGGNVVLSSSKNPVSIPWMVNAVLRERHKHTNPIVIVDCAFDQECVSRTLTNPVKIVLGYTYGDVPVKTSENPFIINLSDLTSTPVNPVIDIETMVLPKISATSQLRELGPYGLLTSMEPGWHAERNPSYPQSITVSFKTQQLLGNIGFLPQDRFLSRMPKSVQIRVSNDGKTWSTVASSDDICITKDSAGWHNVKIVKPVKARLLKIEICSNCGDPEFLTLRGLRFK